MATEQGQYGLAAYFRFLEGETSLYDMTDVEVRSVDDVDDTDVTDDYIVTGSCASRVVECDGRIWYTKEPAVSIFFFKEKPTKKEIVSTIICIAGLCVYFI